MTPKPLIDLGGRPFFWWAVESVARAASIREMVFVVLEEHVEAFAIDREILARYPDAKIVALPEVTAGAAETAAAGIAALETAGPFAVNDCDHAFLAEGLAPVVERLRDGASGALLGFRATSPAYSYVRLAASGAVIGTVEKEVASPFAIAGCYLFASGDTFTARLARYRQECPYAELFLSGLYNELIREGGEVLFHELARHISFGTPEELDRTHPDELRILLEEAP
jgi:NDP-sugar pyrophosphorylase family protein